ncbi:unnamed protein product, partial [Phaeothamnion confervicola]
SSSAPWARRWWSWWWTAKKPRTAPYSSPSKSAKEPNTFGICGCNWPLSEDSNGDCVSGLSANAIAGICVAGVAFLGVVVFGAQPYRQMQADAMWKIPASAITRPTPPVVLGRGTFGEVFKVYLALLLPTRI